MINVSEQLQEESKKNHNYYVTARVTLADGTKLSLEKKDFYLDGNGIIDAADNGDFPIGVAIEKTATLSLVNDKGQFDGYSFNRAVFTIFMNLQLSDHLETFKRGSFVVCKKPAIDDEISLTLLDYMSKADRSYKTNISFPCTAGEVLEDACQQCGIVLGDTEFKNADFQVQKAPEGTTYRAVIGMIAALAGGNARIDEDDMLRIITFSKEKNMILIEMIPWPDIDGQPILDTEGKEILTVYKRITSGHELTAVSEIEKDIDSVTITGVRYSDGSEEFFYGAEGYVVDLSDNQLLSGNAEEGVNRIGQILKGFELLPFAFSSVPLGYVTFGDAIQFEDSKGNLYKTYATDIEFNFADGTELSCKAKSLETQELEYPGGTKALIDQVVGKVEKKISAYDMKLKQMNDMAANTLGFYYTEVVRSDGSVITYRHNKPQLSESKIVYKTAMDGFFVTSDYQGTDEATTVAGKWTSGFDSNGDAVLNILYAIGIQAKWINTRGFTAKDNDGNITFRVNADTGGIEVNPKTCVLGEQTMQEKFSEIDESIASSRNMTLQLDNEYQSISVHNDGSITGDFPSVTTTATVLYNAANVTDDCSFTVTTSDSITGSWDISTHTYTVKSLKADSGWVSIRATYLRTMTLTKMFTVAKLYAGDAGKPGRTFILEPSCNIIKRSADKVLCPNFLEFKAYYMDGDSTQRVAYKGRMVIEQTADGEKWTTIYTSSADEDTVKRYLDDTALDITNIRCRLYAAGGTTDMLDMQSVAIAIDVEALTAEQIVDILTNKGEWKGLYYLNGHLYISFDAALGGVLTLGGEHTGDGRMVMRRSDGTPYGSIDNDGITFFQSYTEDSTGYKYEGYRLTKDGAKKVKGSKSTDVSSPDIVMEDELVIDFDKIRKYSGQILLQTSIVTLSIPSFKAPTTKQVSQTFTKLSDANECVAIFQGVTGAGGMINCCNYSISENKLSAVFANLSDEAQSGTAVFRVLQYGYLGSEF